MQADLYIQSFQAIKPAANKKLEEITQAFATNYPELKPGNVEQRGDEELILSLDFSKDSRFALGIDIILADGSIQEEDTKGFAINLEIQGPGGEPLGTYIPENYTETLYTLDNEKLIQRIESINVTEIVQHIADDLDPSLWMETRSPHG